MIRTQTDQVVRRIRSIVRRSERAHVGSLCVRSSRTDKPRPTYLTTEVVQYFDLTAQNGITNDPINGFLNPRGYRIS